MQAEPTVFIVDDDPAMVESVVGLVELLGFRAEAYYSAADFLRAYRPTRPACLVLDVRMPGMSGLELQKELATAGISLPIIFITGHGDCQVSAEAIKLGAFDFFEKPFHPEEFCNAVRNAIKFSARDRHFRERSFPDSAETPSSDCP